MEKEFVSYEMALALKELGFDEPCIAFYLEKVLTFHTHGIDPHFIFKKNSNLWYSSSAPTYSQAFRFFREKYKLPSWVYTSDNEKFYYGILRDTRFLIDGNKPYETYEEAELACLIKLIEVVILAQKKMI